MQTLRPTSPSRARPDKPRAAAMTEAEIGLPLDEHFLSCSWWLPRAIPWPDDGAPGLLIFPCLLYYDTKRLRLVVLHMPKGLAFKGYLCGLACQLDWAYDARVLFSLWMCFISTVVHRVCLLFFWKLRLHTQNQFNATVRSRILLDREE